MRFPANLLRWLAAVGVTLALAALSLRHYLPPLPNPFTLDLVIVPQAAGKTEPLIVAGRTQAGDFLLVRHLEGNAIAFGYETWGEAGQFSAPFPLPENRRMRLQIQFPGLSQVRGVFAPPNDRLQVIANGQELFNTPVAHHVRLPHEIYFGENPIGGTACDEELNGRLLLPDGRELRGFPSLLFTLRERLSGWIAISRWQAIAAVIAGLLTFVFWEKLRWREFVQLVTVIGQGGRAFNEHRLGGELARRLWAHRWFWFTLAACTLSFTWMVTYGSFRLVYPETFGNFYEHQAASLLQGRLDVPDEAISGEAFIVDGKRYGYFGLTPALLRVPLVIFGVHFGAVSRAFMVLYFVASIVGCYLLLRTVRSLFGFGAEPPSAWATLCFVGGAGAGSTIYYLGSRAYIYHEAILCGVAFAILASWAALRHFGAPERRWWIASLVLGTLSVHARPPTGFFALSFLGAVALAVMIRERKSRPQLRRRQVLIGALCGLGVFSFNVVSYLKFRTFEGCPLRYNVQYDAKRLARIDGKQFHLVNLPIAVDSYLVHPNFRLERGFPYFFIGADAPPRLWPTTKIDYHDNTLAFPYAMPGLFALATVGSLLAFVRHRPQRLLIATIWLAGIPMTLAMFTAIAITHRYTADFCPYLLTAAAVGTLGIEALAPPWRRLLKFGVAVATVAAILITFAITLHYQGQDVWGVPDEVRAKYASMRKGFDLVVEAFKR